jgi:ATP-dependent Clp protease ATP-binding subunit ClpC
VFERFTERARLVVVLAQEEARVLGHNYIGTEHLLLGLLRDEEGLAARVLESLDLTAPEVRAQVRRTVRGGEPIAGMIPFTPRAKRALEFSLREALALGHNYINTEHILLGLVREIDGVARRILLDFDVDEARIHAAVMSALSGGPGLDFRAPEGGAVGSKPETVDVRSLRLPPRADYPLLLAIGLAACAFPLGLLVGWLIWS